MELAFGIVLPGRTYFVRRLPPTLCNTDVGMCILTLRPASHPLQLIAPSMEEIVPWMEDIRKHARIGSAIPVGAPLTGGTNAEVVVSDAARRSAPPMSLSCP